MEWQLRKRSKAIRHDADRVGVGWVLPAYSSFRNCIGNSAKPSRRDHRGAPNDGWLLRAGAVGVGASGSDGLSLRLATLRNS